MDSISNSPTFSLQRQRSEKVGRLELLSNLIPGQQPARTVVLATSLTPESATALTWATQHLCRKGDAVHLVHVVRCLSTPSEVYHSGPGNAFHMVDEGPHHERRDVLSAQAYIRDRIVPQLNAAKLLYACHLYVDTWNAPPDAVGTTWLQLASDLRASAIVMAANDQASREPQHLGSVAGWVVSQQPQPIPVVLVREWQAAAEAPGKAAASPDGPASAAAQAAAAKASARTEEAQQGGIESAAEAVAHDLEVAAIR